MLKRYFPWPFHLATPVPFGICRASFMHILSLWLYSKLLHNSHVSLTHITQGCFVSVKAIAWFQIVDIRNDQIMRLVTEERNCQFGYISSFLMMLGNIWLTIIVPNPTHGPVKLNLWCDQLASKQLFCCMKNMRSCICTTWYTPPLSCSVLFHGGQLCRKSLSTERTCGCG